MNCLVGKASGQPKFGCPFCDTGTPYSFGEYELYTLGDLEDWHEVWWIFHKQILDPGFLRLLSEMGQSTASNSSIKMSFIPHFCMGCVRGRFLDYLTFQSCTF